MPSEADWAYLAGLIDGEGSMFLRYTKKPARRTHYLDGQLRVANTYEPLIDWLVATFGGSKAFHRSNRARHKNGWVWCCHIALGASLLRYCAHHLKIKHRQAVIFMEAADVLQSNRAKRPLGPEERTRREKLVADLAELNRRGVRQNFLFTQA